MWANTIQTQQYRNALLILKTQLNTEMCGKYSKCNQNTETCDRILQRNQIQKRAANTPNQPNTERVGKISKRTTKYRNALLILKNALNTENALLILKTQPKYRNVWQILQTQPNTDTRYYTQNATEYRTWWPILKKHNQIQKRVANTQTQPNTERANTQTQPNTETPY